VVLSNVAALLAGGERPDRFGPSVVPVDLDFGSAQVSGEKVVARVVYVDRFGNLVLNLEQVPSGDLRLVGRVLRKVRTYADAGGIEPLITIGGHGHAEVAVNQGSAAELFGLAGGDRIVLERSNCLE